MITFNNKYKRIAKYICNGTHICDNLFTNYTIKSVSSSNITTNNITYSYNNLTTNYNYMNNLVNKTWLVPPSTLPAYIYNNNIKLKINDQTLWQFDSFNSHYIFGYCYTYLSNIGFTKSKIYGSITPDGKCHINFYDILTTNQIIGIGLLKYLDKNMLYPYFEMQMNGGIDSIMHWSYMIPVTEADYYYNNVPGTSINGNPELSVPEFIQKCEE
jgi:hypothetical protein